MLPVHSETRKQECGNHSRPASMTRVLCQSCLLLQSTCSPYLFARIMYTRPIQAAPALACHVKEPQGINEAGLAGEALGHVGQWSKVSAMLRGSGKQATLEELSQGHGQLKSTVSDLLIWLNASNVGM